MTESNTDLSEATTLRPNRWPTVALMLGAAAVFLAAAVWWYHNKGTLLVLVALGGSALVFVNLALRTLLAYVRIGEEQLEFRSLLRIRRLSREQVTAVNWTHGYPVSIRHSNGRLLVLPEMPGVDQQALAEHLCQWSGQGPE